MNLADAIRRAAHASGQSFTQPHSAADATVDNTIELHPPAETEATTPAEFASPQTPEEDFVNHPASAFDIVHASETAMPEPPAPVVAGGSVVRLELFLAPEQLNSLFRAVVATQHSVMTLREAATFLRIPANKLEQMAHDREIPAFQLEGKWRFPRAAVDEWLTLRTTQRETEAE
jgi:excisionase family DNA binding protein